MKLADNPLLKPYRGKPAILDANILLLHWCASFDRELINTFKRLNSFEQDDLDLLAETLKLFSVLRTTPHVLTEVSNLANSLPKWRKNDWAEHFSCQIEVIPEEWIAAKSVASNPLMTLGLTDVILAELASSHVIITIDWPLTNCLESQGLKVINLTRLRESWLA
jgi:hypothetical protein